MPEHVNSLFQYIFYAPEEVQKRYCNGYHKTITIDTDVLKEVPTKVKVPDGEGGYKVINTTKIIPKKTPSGIIVTESKEVANEKWYNNETSECTFNGILFRESKVYVINIYVFDSTNDYQPEYLEITDIFNQLLETYNIYHLCLIIPKAIRKLYSDSTLTESNLIPYIKYDQPYRLPKLRYNLARHHNKHWKFIISDRKRDNGVWSKILYKAIARISNNSTFAEQRNERPNSLYLIHTEEPKLHIPAKSNKSSDDLSPKGERKARRRFGAFRVD